MSDILNIRNATPEDSRFFWELVNDPVVRNVSFSSEEIPWENHDQWYAKKLAETDTFLFVAETDSGEKIGQLRFENKEEGYVISVSLVEQFRGKGFGSRLIQYGSEKLFELCDDAKIINAYIKHENTASIHSFGKAGYLKKGTATINEPEDAVLMVKTNTNHSTRS